MEILIAILINALVITKFKYLTFDTFDNKCGWTGRMDGRMHGRRQKYTPLTSSVDNKQAQSNKYMQGNKKSKKERKQALIQQFIKNQHN